MTSLTRDDVGWLYRCILSREPESEAAIDHMMSQCATFEEARSALLTSPEFYMLRAVPVFFTPAKITQPMFKARPLKLASASIVKNEAKNVERMLMSILPVSSFVAIIDTGSDDDTVTIADDFLRKAAIPYAIERIEFVDFSSARNKLIDLVDARYQWILMLDADEHLMEEDYWRLYALLDSDVDCWQLPRYNFIDEGKVEHPRPYPDYQKRLLRNREQDPIRFVGPVHETIINVTKWGFAPANEGDFVGGPHIHHMGQVGLSLERWQQKHDFYMKLAENSFG